MAVKMFYHTTGSPSPWKRPQKFQLYGYCAVIQVSTLPNSYGTFAFV